MKMKLDVNKYQDATVEELIAIGKESLEGLAQYIRDIQAAIGKDSEFHPDFWDNLGDALVELGYETMVFFDDYVYEDGVIEDAAECLTKYGIEFEDAMLPFNCMGEAEAIGAAKKVLGDSEFAAKFAEEIRANQIEGCGP